MLKYICVAQKNHYYKNVLDCHTKPTSDKSKAICSSIHPFIWMAETIFPSKYSVIFPIQFMSPPSHPDLKRVWNIIKLS